MTPYKNITVWMPDDDTALNRDIQSDLIIAVEACHGYIMATTEWEWIAVSTEPFTAEEATRALKAGHPETIATNPVWQKPGIK